MSGGSRAGLPRRIYLDRPGATDAAVVDAVTGAASDAAEDHLITELAMREGVLALIVPGAGGVPPAAAGQSGSAEALARAVLQIADAAGMPDTYWQSDSRVGLARAQLGVPADGRHSHAHLWAVPE